MTKELQTLKNEFIDIFQYFSSGIENLTINELTTLMIESLYKSIVNKDADYLELEINNKVSLKNDYLNFDIERICEIGNYNKKLIDRDNGIIEVDEPEWEKNLDD